MWSRTHKPPRGAIPSVTKAAGGVMNTLKRPEDGPHGAWPRDDRPAAQGENLGGGVKRPGRD